MRAAQIADLSGAYGTIQHELIWAKVKHYGLTRIYGTAMVYRVINDVGQMVIDQQALSPATLAYVKQQGLEYGIVRVPDWTGSSEPDLAARCEQDLRALGIPASGQTGASAACAVMVDAEAHAFDISLFLPAWRKLRPARETGWSQEGFQAGLLTDKQVASITSDPNLTVYPQAYRGTMYPFAQDAVKDDMRAKLPAERVRLYYDGQPGAPDRMDGVLYTLERLP